MKSYKIPALLMIIHGGFMDLGGVFCMIPALIFGTDKFDIGKYFAFKLSYLQDNLYMMMIIGAIYGIFRLIGAIGLLMMFLLPAGIMDGILAGSALILILIKYFGNKSIVEKN